MKCFCALLTACGLLLLEASLRAQVPVVPAIPAAPAAAMPAPGFLASLGMACKAKKERCCASPLGKLLASVTRPMQAMTGGVFPSCCPPGPGAAELAAPGAVGAAAKIQAEEAQAKARRAAVKFLATVDCHYYPEAEAALIAALRCDRNECVRWEAAHALASGCCCNKRTIEALTITVSGSERDGNPAETSFRVRAEAFGALEFCLAHHQDAPIRPEHPQPPEQPAALLPTSAGEERVSLAAYYETLPSKPWHDVLREAQQAVARARTSAATGLPPTGQRSLISLWNNALIDPRESISQREPTQAMSPQAMTIERLPPTEGAVKLQDPPLPQGP
jgi:hypothetical protein